jgi:hypothetical protein
VVVVYTEPEEDIIRRKRSSRGRFPPACESGSCRDASSLARTSRRCEASSA